MQQSKDGITTMTENTIAKTIHRKGGDVGCLGRSVG